VRDWRRRGAIDLVHFPSLGAQSASRSFILE